MKPSAYFVVIALIAACTATIRAQDEVPPLALWGRQMCEKEAEFPPKMRREIDKFRKAVTRKLKGNEDTWYAITLSETTWSRSSNKTAKDIVTLVDITLLPITLFTGGFSGKIPDASMSRFDTFDVVLVQGQQVAVDLIVGYALDLEMQPKQPNVIRGRSYAVLKSGKGKEVVSKAKAALEAKVAAADPNFAMRKAFERDRDAMMARMKERMEEGGLGELMEKRGIL